MAGANIPLGLFSETDAEEEGTILGVIAARVARRFFGTLNLEADRDGET